MPAGYSGTPLPRKLGLKPGARLLLVDAPAGFDATLGALPDDVEVQRDLRGRGPYDVLLYFAPDAASLRRRLSALKQRLAVDGGLWIAWPKQSSGVPTDLHDGVVRSTGLAAGLVDNKVCAVDETWSGLRFVYRLEDRPARRAKP